MRLLPWLPWKTITFLLLDSLTNYNCSIIASCSCDIFTEAASIFNTSGESKHVISPVHPMLEDKNLLKTC